MNTLQIEHLSFGFGKKKILQDISIEFHNGMYGIIGPNGAGKTTFFRCLLNLYKNNAVVTLNGLKKEDKQFPYKIGFVPQTFSAFSYLTVYEMMAFYANMQKLDTALQDERIKECLQFVHLLERADCRISKLSGGMLRRLSIAQAIINNPNLIIFDEPTVGLDIEEHLHFLNLVNALAQNKIVILSSHTVADFQSDNTQLILLSKGQITYMGDIAVMCEQAAGHIYEIANEAISKIQGDYRIIKQDMQQLRFAAKQQQELEPVSPTLEDAYIYYLNFR